MAEIVCDIVATIVQNRREQLQANTLFPVSYKDQRIIASRLSPVAIRLHRTAHTSGQRPTRVNVAMVQLDQRSAPTAVRQAFETVRC